MTFDVGKWRCACGGSLDRTDDATDGTLTCRCRGCGRLFRIRVEIHEIVEAERARQRAA